jgi:subtilase family serine protease
MSRAVTFVGVIAVFIFALSASGAAVGSSTSVDFGAISHKGLKSLGSAPTGLKLVLEIGLVYNQQGIANVVKAASNPSSSSYGKYISLSTLQQKYGASSQRRNAVVGAFKPYGVKATVDVTHARVSATISIGNAQKLFATKWNLYATSNKNQDVALPVNTPKLGSFLDITTGTNVIFSGVSCCTSGPGYDMASGLGSPLANEIVNHLHH